MENGTIDNSEDLKRRINELNAKMWYLRNTSSDNMSPEEMLAEVNEKLGLVDYPFGKAQWLLNTAMFAFIVKHDSQRAVALLTDALDMFRQLSDKKWICNTYLTLAIIQNTLINTEQALYNGLKGIDFYETSEADPNDAVMAFYVMGTIYKDIKKYQEAEHYYKKGLAVSGMQQSIWAGRIYGGLSNIYTIQENYEAAVEASLLGLKILSHEKNSIGESRILNDIGAIYKKQKDYENALSYFFKALELRQVVNAKQFALGSLIDIADTYFETGNELESLNYLKKAELYAIEVNSPGKLAAVYRQTGEIYKSIRKYKEAFDYYEKYVNLKLEQTAKENEIKLNNLRNAVVIEKEKEIEHLKNVELKNAYKIISEKNREMTDSINYARRIQHSIITSEKDILTEFKDGFILFKPKDIVSGDFYWGTRSANGMFYLAVCDSTGHGVPGAFMCLLNISFLNEAINQKNISKPNEVFGHVRKRLIETISQEGGKDGMDGILVCFDKQNNTITYAAANNSPVLVSQKHGLLHLPCDKMPVGKGERDNDFVLHTIDHSAGDLLYLYTDGYADQFGGQKGKKFKYKQLDEHLLHDSGKAMNEQKENLLKNFEHWKGNLEQVDDVCVLGIKL